MNAAARVQYTFQLLTLLKKYRFNYCQHFGEIRWLIDVKSNIIALSEIDSMAWCPTVVELFTVFEYKYDSNIKKLVTSYSRVLLPQWTHNVRTKRFIPRITTSELGL